MELFQLLEAIFVEGYKNRSFSLTFFKNILIS